MKINILATLIFFSAVVVAQNVTGVVQTEKGERIWGAVVAWQDNSAQTQTDSLGHFELPRKTVEANLTVRMVGFALITYRVLPSEVDLKLEIEGVQELKAVEIKGKKQDNAVSVLDARQVEHISANELKKAPCCNLSESFETNGSVDVTYSDAITGAKEIQMLGLRGIYTQLMVENRPDFYGLATPYALEYIPGTWLEGIDINKGVGSVKNGFQAITGQINTELEKPGKGKKLFVNLFGESTGRTEINVQTNHDLKKGWFTGLLLHGDWMDTKSDHDHDGFLNMPLKKQANGLYRLFYQSDKMHGQINVQGIKEERRSGQIVDNHSFTNPFLINANTERLSVFGKFAYTGFAKPFQQLGSQWAVTHHKLDALYGRNVYNGTQNSFYGNVIYGTIIGTTDHKLNVGTSYQYDDYREYLNDKNFSRTEGVAGAFGEYTFNQSKLGAAYNQFTMIAGLRTDYHNLFGLLVTPRLNLKYNFSENEALRFAAGRGLRVSNPIAENVGFLATNRAIVVGDNLKPEDAWNIGLNYVKVLKINGLEWRLSADAYRTEFVNQIVTDIETDYKTAKFYNLAGKSYANSFLVMLNAEILRGLDVKLVYKFNDVKTTYQGKLASVPLVAKNRGLVTVDYRTPNKNWLFNLTTQLVGTQRLADRSYVPHDLLHNHAAETTSPAYMLLNASINRKFKYLELYGGGENLTDYTQHDPIIAAENPSSPYFDATQVYAPLMGTRFYLGLRWWID